MPELRDNRGGNKGDALVVREYRDADLAEVVGVFTRAIHVLAVGHYDARQRAAWAPAAPDLPAWRSRLASQSVLVADSDGVIAGFLAYTTDGHIDLLYCAPEFARHGVASALYERAQSVLDAAGAAAAYTEASLVARPFFEARGFGVEAEQYVERGGVGFVRFAMRKPLTRTGP